MAALTSAPLLVAAFAGGAFGAAVGALPAFTFTGVLVLLGETLRMAGRTLREAGPALAGAPITDELAFGVVFGPHVSFGGGAAALAYAAHRDRLDTDFPYHEAKHVTRGLGTAPDVLLVGGAFGVFGHLVATTSAALALPVDPVALGVVASALAHRAVLGYDLIGVRSGFFDMSPFERGETIPDGGLAVEPWLPYQYRWPGVALLGVVAGVLGAYIAYHTGSAFFGFGVSVALLVFVNADVADVPVTHHVTLPAGTVVLALAGLPPGERTAATVAAALPLGTALLAGAVAGLVGALAGEVCQRVLYAHADTHLDPPAASIVLTSAAIGVLAALGVFPGPVWVPHP
jgi:hypothetical protein